MALDCSIPAIERTANYLWGAAIRTHQSGLAESKQDGHISAEESRANNATYTLQASSSRMAQTPSREILNEVENDYSQAGTALLLAQLHGEVVTHLDSVRKLIWGLNQCL